LITNLFSSAEVETWVCATFSLTHVNTALQEVLKTAIVHDGRTSGIHDSVKALDKRQAHLCVLASNCDKPMHVKVVEALCAEHHINLSKADDSKKLGEQASLCKINQESARHLGL
jgi:small subunit ribosomal protein S12e